MAGVRVKSFDFAKLPGGHVVVVAKFGFGRVDYHWLELIENFVRQPAHVDFVEFMILQVIDFDFAQDLAPVRIWILAQDRSRARSPMSRSASS